jgi:two-component system chemotaxis sensor kinase CheA
VAELTHQMESLLDKLRRHELQPSAPMVDVLLESSDALRLLLARHQGKRIEAPATAELVQRISALAHGTAEAPVAIAPDASAVAAVNMAPVAIRAPALPAGARELELHIGPLENPTQADGIAELFRDIPGLGDISSLPCDQSDKRVYRVVTTANDTDLLDLFTFHVSKEQIHIFDAATAPAGAGSDATATPLPLPLPPTVPRPHRAPISASSTVHPACQKQTPPCPQPLLFLPRHRPKIRPRPPPALAVRPAPVPVPVQLAPAARWSRTPCVCLSARSIS